MTEDRKNQFMRWLASKLPRRLAYWAAIRVIAHATQGDYKSVEVTSVSVMDALDRWEIR